MRSHVAIPPLSHTRAPARAECDDPGYEELELLVLELALVCFEGAALGRSVMMLQDAADESEVIASSALAVASDPRAGVEAWCLALEAAASLGRIERAELAASARWAAHAERSRGLALRALAVTGRGGSRARRSERPPADSV